MRPTAPNPQDLTEKPNPLPATNCDDASLAQAFADEVQKRAVTRSSLDTASPAEPQLSDSSDETKMSAEAGFIFESIFD